MRRGGAVTGTVGDAVDAAVAAGVGSFGGANSVAEVAVVAGVTESAGAGTVNAVSGVGLGPKSGADSAGDTVALAADCGVCESFESLPSAAGVFFRRDGDGAGERAGPV